MIFFFETGLYEVKGCSFSESLIFPSIRPKYGERYKKSFTKGNLGILLPKLFWPSVGKNCSSDREKLLQFEAEGQEFAKNLRSHELFKQWKVRTIFDDRMLF